MAPLPLWLRYRYQGSLDRLPGYRVHHINQRAKDTLRTQNYQLGNWGGYYPVAGGHPGAAAYAIGRKSANEVDTPDAPTLGIASTVGACYPDAAPSHYIERRYDAYVKAIYWERPEIVDHDHGEADAEF